MSLCRVVVLDPLEYAQDPFDECVCVFREVWCSAGGGSDVGDGGRYVKISEENVLHKREVALAILGEGSLTWTSENCVE